MLRHGDGDTSVDSKMDDTPANYNVANQRFDADYDDGMDAVPEDENAEHMAPSEYDERGQPILPMQKQRRPKKKRKAKQATIEFLEPTNRERSMAGAYGGNARGQMRRPGIKYEKDRLANSKKFRVNTAEESKVRATLEKLANTVSGFEPTGTVGKAPRPRHQGLMNNTNGFDSNEGNSNRSGQLNQSRTRGGADSQAKIQDMRESKNKGKQGMKDGDFERMFGKDID